MKEYKLNIFDAIYVMEEAFRYIKSKKGNIPIDHNLFEKYDNVTNLMSKEINNIFDVLTIKNNISELSDIENNRISDTQLYHFAVAIFKKYNNSNIFFNDGNKIIVSNGDIKESVNKILHNLNQRKYLKEHLQVFSCMSKIITSAILVSQTIERKNRNNNYVWNYYVKAIKVNNIIYLLQFDVISRSNGENHYRVQRLKKAVTSAGNVE